MLPELIVEQTFDPETNETFPEDKEPLYFKYKEAELKIAKLKDFLRPFVRNGIKDEPDYLVEYAEHQLNLIETGTMAAYQTVNQGNFKEKVINNELPHLVYYTTLAKGADISREFPMFNRMLRYYKGILNVVVYNMDPTAANHAELVKKYKLGTVSAGKPKMRFYPNQFKGDMKVSKSYKIFFETKAKDLKKITKQIKEGYESKIISSLTPDGLSGLLKKHGKDEYKDCVFLLYRNDQQMELNFKGLSEHPVFKDNTVFLAQRDPDLSKMNNVNLGSLPMVGIVRKLQKHET